MDQAIYIPELLFITFSRLQKKDLGRAALVCRAWTDCAVDTLWGSTCVPFNRLIERLGPIKTPTRNGPQFHALDPPSGHVSEEQWRRFLRYSQVVTNVELSVFALDFSTIQLIQGLANQYDIVLFPKLRSITVECSPHMAPTALLLFSPSLESVALHSAGDLGVVIIPVLKTIAEAIPRTLVSAQTLALSLSNTALFPDFSLFRNLRKLRIHAWQGLLSFAQIHVLLNVLPLTSLECDSEMLFDLIGHTEGVLCSQSLEYLRLAGWWGGEVFLQRVEMPNLLELDTPTIRVDDSDMQKVLDGLRTRCPSLERLSLEVHRPSTTNTLAAALSLPKLRHLTMIHDDTLLFEDDGFRQITSLAAHIQSFTLSHPLRPYSINLRLTPLSLQALAQHAPNLLSLDFYITLKDYDSSLALPPFQSLEVLRLTLVPFSMATWRLFAEKLAAASPKLGSFEVKIFGAHLSAAEEVKAEHIFWSFHASGPGHRRAPGWRALPRPDGVDTSAS